MTVTSAETIFERHHLAVYRYFRRLTGRRDVAQDLTQEVFLRVVRGLGSYRAFGREHAWLFKIATNLLVDYWRKGDAAPETTDEVGTIAVDSDHLLAFGLQEALNLLSETDRHVFVLYEVAGLSYAEVAEVCETTVEGVRSRLRRARLQLRHWLGGRLATAATRERRRDS